jgi:hypothetical protein
MTGYSRVQRLWNRLRNIDLDSAPTRPEAITVLESDEFGPLVIAIANARVFPDGSVNADGRWISSAKFGLSAPSQRSKATISVDTECAVVPHLSLGQRDLVESVGPRLATLGRTRPGTPVFVPSTRHPLTQTVELCSLTTAGVIIRRGSALSTPVVLFARLPVADDRDGQQLRFAQLFHHRKEKSSGRVYLESDAAAATSKDGSSMVDVRFSHEQAGSTLVPAQRFRPGDIAGLAAVVSRAAELVIESEDVRTFASFALPTTPVTVASPSLNRRRNPARMTATARFEMDEALRHEAKLPRGVEVLAQPDYDVTDTTVAKHRVFLNGKWRPQSHEVMVERSLGPWIISVKNAIVAPNGSVMLEDGTQLGGGYFGEITNAPLIDGWVVDETTRPSGLAITKHHAFGHGLLQVAPRLDALMQHDRALDVLVPDFAWDDSALLARVGVVASQVRRVSLQNQHHLVRVPELIVSTHLHPEQYTARADPKWQAEFVSRFLGASAPTPSRRVYFARRGATGERGGCVNRHVLNDLANEFDYEEVHPELLSFDEQVELAASTVDAFGERGSALNWSLFMPSGSRTVVVNGKQINRTSGHRTFHNPVLAARGSQYLEINAVLGGTHTFFEVDPVGVRRALERMS